jgi:hypothetical protein
LAKKKETILSSNFTNLDEDENQIVIELFNNFANDLTISIKRNLKETLCVKTDSAIPPRLYLKVAGDVIGVCKQINIRNVASKRRCNNSTPPQFSDDQAFANLASKLSFETSCHLFAPEQV